MPSHLSEDDYIKQFPAGLDEFPTLVDRDHYIDAWHLNTIFDSILRIEQYYLDHKESIEAASMESFEGADGLAVIPIPAGRYAAGKTCTAVDSDLVAGNIKSGASIFGVSGSFAGGGGGPSIALPSVSFLEGALVYATPPSLSATSALPSVAVPSVSAA